MTHENDNSARSPDGSDTTGPGERPESSDHSGSARLGLPEALELAVRHHRAGRLREAEQVCMEMLRVQPKNAAALHLFGLISIQARRAARAVELIAKAVALDPGCAPFHNSLGVALRQQERFDESTTSFTRALSIEPDYVAAQDNLVKALREQRLAGAPKPETDPAGAHPQTRDGDRKSRLILGIGTGRSGSTTLVKLLQRQPEAAISHERPPRLTWLPQGTRLLVHLRCFEEMLLTHRLVGDVSHWWLPYLPQLFERLPDLKVIALRRDREATISSFEKIKGSGPKALNHWCDHMGEGWRQNAWDECYPSYDRGDRRLAIGRYWDEYYAEVERLQVREPERVFLAPIDILNSEQGQDRLFDFLGLDDHVHAPIRKYNVAAVADGAYIWR